MLDITKDENWKILLGRIKAGKCTPFLGAGASYGTFPLGSDIAQAWAKNINTQWRILTTLLE
jgi:hypothetical protein